MQRGGDRLRVNVQLVDAETGGHLWADRFDKPIADLFDVQDEIVSRPANTLDAQPTSEFIRRFLIHLLPKGLHRIRHYGLFAKSACAGNIARARELLAAAKPEGQPTATAVDPNKPSCPCCDGRMIIIEVFARGGAPRHRPTAPTNCIRVDTS